MAILARQTLRRRVRAHAAREVGLTRCDGRAYVIVETLGPSTASGTDHYLATAGDEERVRRASEARRLPVEEMGALAQ